MTLRTAEGNIGQSIPVKRTGNGVLQHNQAIKTKQKYQILEIKHYEQLLIP